MARHLKNVQCPKCAERGQDRSANNLGTYDDGSVYCFKCGYYQPSTTATLHNIVERGQKDVLVHLDRSSAILPYDCNSYIPAMVRIWLKQYGLTESELVSNKLMWSESWQQLIFPYFDKYNNLVAWQGRSFDPAKQRKHKWFSQGNLQNLYHIIGEHFLPKSDSLIIVEDIISAIKISRVAAALPIFGTNIASRFKGLAMLTKNLVLWLDPDMKNKMVVEAARGRSLGFNVRIIFSEKDPKYYGTEEISQRLAE